MGYAVVRTLGRPTETPIEYALPSMVHPVIHTTGVLHEESHGALHGTSRGA